MTIIISDGKKTIKVEQSEFPHEGNLQQYISDHPECLPVYEIDEDAELLIICREFHTSHGAIDVLGVDASGNIYIIETKLYKNPDKRKVIAQLFDYGASLWKGYSDADDFVSAMERPLRANGKSLIGLLEETFEYDVDDGPTNTVSEIKQNLQEGRFRFIVLMDQIDDRLKTLISFINVNSQFDVYAVELKYYKHKEGEVMIPELFGGQLKKDNGVKTASAGGSSWNATRFFADAKQRLEANELAAVEELYDYSMEQAADMRWGRGIVGAFHPKFSQVRKPGQKWWSPYSVSSEGELVLRFFRAKTKRAELFCHVLLSALKNQKFKGVPDIPRKTTLSIGEWKPQIAKFKAAVEVALMEWEKLLVDGS